ncbi:MAG: hypothetical protein RL414_404 [Actinomycetota bacterium]
MMAKGRARDEGPSSVLPDGDELVRKASKGDNNAFVLLWEFFYPKILKYLRAFTREAEDLCSETWIKIASAIKGFPGDFQAFRAWIFTIARNTALDHLRKLKRRGPHVEIEDGDWIHHDSSSVEITDLLDRLPAEQAEVILLRVVVGFDVAQVARITQKSEANVRVLAHRGLNKLQELLEASGYVAKGGKA